MKKAPPAKDKDKVFQLFKELSGNKFKEVLATSKQLQKEGKSRNRAMADALDFYGLGGSK